MLLSSRKFMVNFFPIPVRLQAVPLSIQIGENLFIIFLLILLGLMLLFAGIIYQRGADNKKLLAQKKQLDEIILTKTKLLSIIGHDMRAPLNSIYNLIQLLKSDALEKEQQQLLLDNLSISTASSIETLNNIFEWGRSQLNPAKTEPRKLNLAFLAQTNFDLLFEIASQKNIRLLNNIPPHLNITGDLAQISFIIRNLLGNAIKFSFPGTQVEVCAEEAEGNLIHVCVKDLGVGISRENIQKILLCEEIFSTAGTANEKGSGLGLYLSREFIEQNGGKLSIRSEHGQGSEFCFTLPKVVSDLKPVAAGY